MIRIKIINTIKTNKGNGMKQRQLIQTIQMNENKIIDTIK